MTVSVLEKRANLNYAGGKPTGNLYLKPDCSWRLRLNPSISYSKTNVVCVAFGKFLLLGCSGAWSKVWTKLQLGQTNSCLGSGEEDTGGVHPFLPHTPVHPTPQCHFTSDLIDSPHSSFMFTLTSFSLCHLSLGRSCSIMVATKTLKTLKSLFAFTIFLFHRYIFTASYC